MNKRNIIYIILALALLGLAVLWYQSSQDESQGESKSQNASGQSETIDSAQCQVSNRGMDSMHRQQLTIEKNSGELLLLDTFIADDNTERAYGYQNICEEVIAKTSILFVFDKPVIVKFHMRNVKAPLDIGFFDGAGRLIDVQTMQTYEKGGEEKVYGPYKPFQYVLEVPAGFFRKNDLRVGEVRIKGTEQY